MVSLKYGVYLRGFIALAMILIRKTTLTAVLSDPKGFMQIPLFMGLQSFLYKVFLCAIRRYRQKSDEDGKNSFLAGCISGLSILTIPEPWLRNMLALYMMVRSLKVFLDTREAKG